MVELVEHMLLAPRLRKLVLRNSGPREGGSGEREWREGIRRSRRGGHVPLETRTLFESRAQSRIWSTDSGALQNYQWIRHRKGWIRHREEISYLQSTVEERGPRKKKKKKKTLKYRLNCWHVSAGFNSSSVSSMNGKDSLCCFELTVSRAFGISPHSGTKIPLKKMFFGIFFFYKFWRLLALIVFFPRICRLKVWKPRKGAVYYSVVPSIAIRTPAFQGKKECRFSECIYQRVWVIYILNYNFH